MQPKIVTIANEVNGGVYSITSKCEWDCLLAKLEAHCLQHVDTQQRCLSFASLPDGGIFTIVPYPVEYVSFSFEDSMTQLVPSPVYWNILDDRSSRTHFGEETGSLQRHNTRQTKTLQYVDMSFAFYRNGWNQTKEGARADLWKVYLGDDNREIAEVCSQLAQDYLVHGNSTEAMKMYRKSLSIELMFLGKNHPSVSKTYNNIGTVYWMQGEHEEARRMHQLALTTRLDAIEERYSEAHWGSGTAETWGEAKLGEGVKSYDCSAQTNATSMDTFQTHNQADVEIFLNNDTFTQETSEQSNNSPSPSSESRNEDDNPINDNTTAPSHSRMNLASTTLRENCNFQRPAFSYLIQ